MNLTNTLFIGAPISRYLVGENYSIPQAKYNRYKVGMIMHDHLDDSINYSRETIESIISLDFDYSALADQVASLGYIDFIIFRAKRESGFCYWPTEVEFNNGVPFTYNGVTVPQVDNYNIGNSYYSGIGVGENRLSDAITAFKAKGIDVGIHFAAGRDHNVRTDLSDAELKNSSNSAIYNRYDEYHEYVVNQINELLRWYDFDMLWIDNMTKHPWKNNSGVSVRWDNHLDIYDNAKAIRRDIIFNGNLNVKSDGESLYTNGSIQWFPQDVISQEYQSRVADGEFVDAMTHDGSNYVIPKEYLYDGLYNDVRDAQFSWWDPLASDAPANVNSIRTQQQFQDNYDNAIALGATPIFNIGPYPASIGSNIHLIDSTYLSRLQNIIL